jgi:hypothetical protein
MKVIPLPLETQARLGFNTKIILDYTDLSGTGVAGGNNPYPFTNPWTTGVAQAVLPPNALGASTVTLPAGTRIQGNMCIRVVTAFLSSGGVITTLTFSLGDGGSATRYVNAQDLKTTGYKVGAETGLLNLVADTLDAVATIVGQTMASLNAGQVEILCNVIPVADLAAVV